VIGHLECRKFGKSKNGKIWRYGSPKIRKFKNLVNRTFGNSQNRRFGKTEIRQIAKSERKGILKNKRITGMSVKLLFHPHLRVSRPSGHFYRGKHPYKHGAFESCFPVGLYRGIDPHSAFVCSHSRCLCCEEDEGSDPGKHGVLKVVLQ